MSIIYKITNDINNKIYIGKTCNSLNYRWQQHFDAYTKYDWHIYRAMRKYGFTHFNIEIIEECSDDILNDREKYWIEYYDSYNNGYNSTLGGDGRPQIDRNFVREEWLMGNSPKQIANTLGVWPSSIIDILKELNLYDKKEITKRKQIDASNSQTEKRIYQYNENGELLNIYNSAYEASIKLNVPCKGIRSALDQHKGGYGYFWIREGDPVPVPRKIKKFSKRKIFQYDLNNNYLKTYETAVQAAKELNIDPSGILKACHGKQKTAGGYIWKQEEQLY